ncbi:MAG: S8 family serine peptidase, partial [Phycisphaerales bacterium]|nr:S8 family serine peptidase [Phycisphaerales bacterium]
MDPALHELLEGDAQELVEAVIRLEPRSDPPPGVVLIARFGDIATCRLPRGSIADTWASESVRSLKAPRRFAAPEHGEAVAEKIDGQVLDGIDAGESDDPSIRETDQRRPPDLTHTGHGVVVAVLDWGFDLAHPNLRNADGSTRVRALWDQSAPGPPPQPYGYGRVHYRADIDNALRGESPYEALGYHPGSGDPRGQGAHGTHVSDIAGGNGLLEGSPRGLAPESEFLLVNLAVRGASGTRNLGDSVTLLEALDWVRREAGDDPFVINMSVGKHAGPHDGRTLVEQAMDLLQQERPGRCIVQSVGNYYAASAHASGRLRPGQSRGLHWRIDPRDPTPNELEIWYSGRDILRVEVEGPGPTRPVRVPLGAQATLVADGREVGRVYHRARDPGNGDNHIDIFLRTGAPAEDEWLVTLVAEDVVDGRYHAWVERDSSCRTCQSRLAPEDFEPSTTTGTICNGLQSITVGAVDGHAPDRPLARFSSAGPTVDGRVKPDLVAPGVKVLAARSTPRSHRQPDGGLVRFSGTSMAAPHVTGTVACMFQAAGRPLTIQETRRLLLTAARPVTPSGDDDQRQTLSRAGSGHLDVSAAVAAAGRLARDRPGTETNNPSVETESAMSVVDQPNDVATQQEISSIEENTVAINVLDPAIAGQPVEKLCRCRCASPPDDCAQPAAPTDCLPTRGEETGELSNLGAFDGDVAAEDAFDIPVPDESPEGESVEASWLDERPYGAPWPEIQPSFSLTGDDGSIVTTPPLNEVGVLSAVLAPSDPRGGGALLGAEPSAALIYDV